jgi:hypothetical protein
MELNRHQANISSFSRHSALDIVSILLYLEGQDYSGVGDFAPNDDIWRDRDEKMTKWRQV